MGAVVMAWRVCLIFSLRVSVFSWNFLSSDVDVGFLFHSDSIYGYAIAISIPSLLNIYFCFLLFIFSIFQFYKKTTHLKLTKLLDLLTIG